MVTGTTEKIVTRIEANPLLSTGASSKRHLRVAAYCRVSTDSDDQLNSYEAQKAYYTDYISHNPQWSFAGIYADEGITGTSTAKRESFRRMIKDCNKGKIDLVLTKSVSRFARNTVDTLKYVRELKAKGIGVFFEEQNCNSLNEESEMYIGIYGVIAQTESENISANVRWGIQKRMKDGTYSVRFNLLGYRKTEDGEIVIVPEEAEIVRKLFSMYLDGKSLDQLKSYLESNGIKTYTGKSVWSKNGIKQMLQNEKYVGDLLYQKTFRTDCISKKTIVNNGERTRYLVSNNHPAIIDRETFKLVQLELASRISKRKKSDKTIMEQGRYSGKYELSNVLVCGECGSPFRRTIKSSKGEQIAYWRCLNRMDNGKEYCRDSHGVLETKLHEAIGRTLSKCISEKAAVSSLVLSNIQYVVTGDYNALDVCAIDKTISDLQTDSMRIMSLCSQTGGSTEMHEAELQKIFEKIRVLREQRELAVQQAKENEAETSEIQRITRLISSGNISFDEFSDVTVHHLIECIRVMKDKTIEILFKDGSTVCEKI